MPVQRQKKTRQNPSGTFVAVYERMIAGKTEGVGRRQPGGVLFTIKPLVDWTRQRGFEHRLIAHPRPAAMLSKLPIVNSESIGHVEPTRLDPVGHPIGLEHGGCRDPRA